MWTTACEMIDRAEPIASSVLSAGRRVDAELSWEPPIDITETDSEILITIALPGVDPDAMKVSVDADEISVVGFRRASVIPRGSRVHRLEIPYGKFERRIRVQAAAPARPIRTCQWLPDAKILQIAFDGRADRCPTQMLAKIPAARRIGVIR
jgi:HSP20 family protein